MKILPTIVLSFAVLGLMLTPISVEAASKKPVLESSVYVTPGGVPVIRQPKGWTAYVLVDKAPEAYVFFTNPQKTITLQVGVGKAYPESETYYSRTEFVTNLYGGSGTYQGKKLSGKILKKKEIRMGEAFGIDLEMKRTDLGGKFRLRHVAVDTVGPDYAYNFSTKVAEKEWKKNKAVIEASLATLQIK